MAGADTTEMSRRWDEFAERDALYYVATRRRPWDRDAFFATGRAAVERVLRWIGPAAGRERLLEIGCGLGRTALHFAAHFERVDGVDVSPAMIEQARRQALPENVHLHVGTGRNLDGFEPDAFDVVYSALVFQHVPDEAVVDEYLRETYRVLRPGGRAALQFDTRRDHAALRLYKALPDAVLPRAHRRFIRRYRRDAAGLRRRLRAAGLALVGERGEGTAEHFFLVTPAGGRG